MKDLREEVGTKDCTVGKIVKSRMKWAGHMVRMKDERSPERCERKKLEGCRKRGRPQLRWEDCVERDLRKAEEEEKWRDKASNRIFLSYLSWLHRRTRSITNEWSPRPIENKLRKQPYFGVATRPASPLQKGTRGRTTEALILAHYDLYCIVSVCTCYNPVLYCSSLRVLQPR